jgi:hypothetical protein
MLALNALSYNYRTAAQLMIDYGLIQSPRGIRLNFCARSYFAFMGEKEDDNDIVLRCPSRGSTTWTV